MHSYLTRIVLLARRYADTIRVGKLQDRLMRPEETITPRLPSLALRALLGLLHPMMGANSGYSLPKSNGGRFCISRAHGVQSGDHCERQVVSFKARESFVCIIPKVPQIVAISPVMRIPGTRWVTTRWPFNLLIGGLGRRNCSSEKILVIALW